MKKWTKVLVVFLSIALCASLYFNFKLSEPLYVLEAKVPQNQDGSVLKSVDSLNSTADKEAFLAVMNILEAVVYFDEYDGEFSRTVPDLFIARSIPSLGVTNGVYGIFFENDGAYIINGVSAEDETVYKLSDYDAEIIDKYIDYK